ncbi:glycosyltransferase family 2 protein [Nocardioides sp.]|uniref:glycosyltransferase family 2 protein n=1 Tax=Nocardioides sp. TaxID=35761 RepID=UPI0035633B2B
MSLDGRPAVTVAICTHASERIEDLAAGLAGVAEQTLEPVETLIVVDRNPELEAEVRRRWPEVRVVTNTDHGGIAGARNTGLGAATGEVVAFLDDDAVPHPDWLARLAEPFADPTVQVVGGWVEPAWDQERPQHLPPELDWLVGCSHRTRPDAVADVRNVVGASLSLRRGLIESVGGFDQRVSRRGDVPLGCDETEFCIRVGQKLPGSRIVLQPRAVVRHRVTANRTTWRYLRARAYAEGLSKAVVAELVGADDATSDERRYVWRVLPRAFVREFVHGRWRGSVGVMTALTWTGWGYLTGRLRH